MFYSHQNLKVIYTCKNNGTKYTDTLLIVNLVIFYLLLLLRKHVHNLHCRFAFCYINNFSSIEGEESIASPAQERKFLVFEAQLLQLFYICPKCASPSLAQVQGVVGSMVRIGQTCGVCGFHRIWSSQPMVGAVPAGNLLISAGLLFSGTCCTTHNCNSYWNDILLGLT